MSTNETATEIPSDSETMRDGDPPSVGDLREQFPDRPGPAVIDPSAELPELPPPIDNLDDSRKQLERVIEHRGELLDTAGVLEELMAVAAKLQLVDQAVESCPKTRMFETVARRLRELRSNRDVDVDEEIGYLLSILDRAIVSPNEVLRYEANDVSVVERVTIRKCLLCHHDHENIPITRYGDEGLPHPHATHHYWCNIGRGPVQLYIVPTSGAPIDSRIMKKLHDGATNGRFIVSGSFLVPGRPTDHYWRCNNFPTDQIEEFLAYLNAGLGAEASGPEVTELEEAEVPEGAPLLEQAEEAEA